MSREAAELRRLQAAAGETVETPATRGRWRAVEPEAGDPMFVCAGCWPAVEAEWGSRSGVTVRVLRRRPAGRAGACATRSGCADAGNRGGSGPVGTAA